MKKKHKHKWKYQINVKKKVIVLVILGVSLFVGLGYALILSDFSLGGIIEYSKYEPPSITEEIINKASTGCVKKYTGNHQDSMDSSKSTEDIYYFDGYNDNCDIDNLNNVVFAGQCWQILRTTDTGGIRMVYNGEVKITYSGNKTNYYCGNERPDYHLNPTISDDFLMWSGTYYFASDYINPDDPYSDFTLKNPKKIVFTETPSQEEIEEIAANYPYTCRGDTTSCNYTSFSKIDHYVESTPNVDGTTVNGYVTIRRSSANSGYYDNDPMATGGYMHGDKYQKKTIKLDTAAYFNSGTIKIAKERNGLELVNPVSVSASAWANGYDTTYKDYVYTCGNTSSTCTNGNLRYITAKESNIYGYAKNYNYGKSVIYEDGLYKLQDVVGLEALADQNTLSTHHYVCLELGATECEKVAYIYWFPGPAGIWWGQELYYIELDADTRNINEVLEYLLTDNSLDSLAKTAVETWYEKKLENTIFESKIEDTIYCNDRSFSTVEGNKFEDSGWNPNGGKPANSIYYKQSTLTSDLSCNNITDRFSVTNNKAKLKYPVALATAAEINMIYDLGTRNDIMLLMTPYTSNGGNENKIYYYDNLNRILPVRTSEGWGISPTISLNSGVKISRGDGAADNPYIIAPNDGWYLVNDKIPLISQKSEYWLNGHKIESGWRNLNDLSGNPNTYYFENGYAKHGWHEENGKKYYLSTFDDDDNGYIDGRRLNGETREIDGVEYTFDENGVCTNCN